MKEEETAGAQPIFTGLLHKPPDGWVSPVRKNTLRYKVIAFDCDGTLLRGPDFQFSWEAIWRSLGFADSLQTDLRRQYRQQALADSSRGNRVSAYKKWCDEACADFKERGLTRTMVTEICRGLSLTNSCREAMKQLRDNGLVIGLISGGVSQFLDELFPDFKDYVDFAYINELVFAPDGKLEGVRATEYDFEGKAEALGEICKAVGCTKQEAVFVGDQFNDEGAMLGAALAIAYPSRDQVVTNVRRVEVREDDLNKILPYVLVS
jgi:phosphoserine phosphatase